MDALKLYVAQGFGLGRFPYAPGTVGSLGGLLWTMLLMVPGNLWVFLAGTMVGLALSVWLCGDAERLLQQKDPPSVVLDELTALPLCFLPWMISAWIQHRALPAPDSLFAARTWIFTAVLFGLFRLLDVVKPWPIRSSQRLPGGWGVTVDDVLAALGVALVSLAFVV